MLSPFGIGIFKPTRAWIYGANYLPNCAETPFILDEQITVSNKELSKSNINIFPNPVSDFLYLKSLTPRSKCYIFNSVGKIVKQFSTGESSFELYLGELESGIYYLNVNGRSQKFIKA